jgi:hypothetical protein
MGFNILNIFVFIILFQYLVFTKISAIFSYKYSSIFVISL